MTAWTADGYIGWTADGYVGWSADGYGGVAPPAPAPTQILGSIVADGQKLTPYYNVSAFVRVGGDTWGAYGGGGTPVFGPLPVLANQSRGIRQSNVIFDVNNRTVLAGESRGAVRGKTADQVTADDSTSQVWTADMESPGVTDSQL